MEGRYNQYKLPYVFIYPCPNPSHTWPTPSHYLNQRPFIVKKNIRNTFQWNGNRNSNIFIQENAFEVSSGGGGGGGGGANNNIKK